MMQVVLDADSVRLDADVVVPENAVGVVLFATAAAAHGTVPATGSWPTS
jgi:hypothetical protein